MLLLSCKKKAEVTENYTCTTCNKTPEAIAANDVSSKGIYKGVIIGSTGTIKFDIANNSNVIKATMVLDGTTFTLTSNVNWVNGQAYIAPFTGTVNGNSATINFSVNANGQGAVVTSVNIPGHANASFDLVKETSSALVECFEGKYSTTKPENGTFNMMICRPLLYWTGSHRKDGDSRSESMSGKINADGGLYQDGTSYIGTLTGDAISGTFKDNDNKNVTVSGKRTL